jgi:hypothetical protein
MDSFPLARLAHRMKTQIFYFVTKSVGRATLEKENGHLPFLFPVIHTQCPLIQYQPLDAGELILEILGAG